MHFFKISVLLLISLFISSCTGSKYQDPKINFDLSEFTDDGFRERPKGESTPINYEFCIPAEEEKYDEVRKIDSTAALYKGSKGRSGCTDKEWLVIGSSHQAGFKIVITKLASLKYIRKINETFWE